MLWFFKIIISRILSTLQQFLQFFRFLKVINIIRVLQSIGANEGFMGLKMSCWLVFCVNEMIFKIVISRSESRFGRFVEVFDL